MKKNNKNKDSRKYHFNYDKDLYHCSMLYQEYQQLQHI